MEGVERLPGPGGFAARAAAALALRPAAYQTVAADEGAGFQAGLVVGLAAAGAAASEATLAPAALAWQAAASMAHWFVWIPTALWTARLLGGSAPSGAVARALAFAKAPGLVAGLAVVPVVGGLLHAVTLPWMLATGVVAVRATFGFGPWRAALVALPGLVLYWAVLALLF